MDEGLEQAAVRGGTEGTGNERAASERRQQRAAQANIDDDSHNEDEDDDGDDVDANDGEGMARTLAAERTARAVASRNAKSRITRKWLGTRSNWPKHVTDEIAEWMMQNEWFKYSENDEESTAALEALFKLAKGNPKTKWTKREDDTLIEKLKTKIATLRGDLVKRGKVVMVIEHGKRQFYDATKYRRRQEVEASTRSPGMGKLYEALNLLEEGEKRFAIRAMMDWYKDPEDIIQLLGDVCRDKRIASSGDLTN